MVDVHGGEVGEPQREHRRTAGERTSEPVRSAASRAAALPDLTLSVLMPKSCN
jgi:hypothetical protein